MSEVPPKSLRIQLAFENLHSMPPASTGIEAYLLFARAIDKVEDAALGPDSYNPPPTFLDGTQTERMYMTFLESVHPVPLYSGVRILVNVRQVVFISRHGAIEVQEKTEEDPMGIKKHFKQRRGLVRLEKYDADGHGVWHEKNR